MATYKFDKLPSTVEEFKACLYLDLKDAHNTFAMFIVAIDIFVKDQAAGVECLNILKGPVPLTNQDISFIKERFSDKKYLPKVYFEGATPANNYTPSEPLTIVTKEDNAPQYTAGENFKRVFVKQEGFDSPRYATFRLKGDDWFLYEYSGILMSVKTPAAQDPWA